MTPNLYSSSHGPITLLPGWSAYSKAKQLPHAALFSMTQPFGSIHLQEITTGNFLLRYFIFYFLQPVTLLCQEKNEGLQSLLSMKGSLHHGLKKQKKQLISEGQFTLLNVGMAQTETLVPPGKECHLLNTYYAPGSYADLIPLFPSLQKDLAKAARASRFFLPFPIPARPSLLDAIYKTLHEEFRPQLLKAYWDIKLKESLFTSLAQAYTEKPYVAATHFEIEKATQARAIIETNIKLHYTNEELAAKVNCSESALKTAFSKQYGLGMYEYLTMLRMQKARELLLQGHLVKSVALDVGMQPSNFTMEFQKYFGYKATSLYRSKE